MERGFNLYTLLKEKKTIVTVLSVGMIVLMFMINFAGILVFMGMIMAVQNDQADGKEHDANP
ncbi:hypothetical protein [Sphingobacterium sp. NPDC055346]